MSTIYPVAAIAIARTPYHGKFGIPRQSGLVDVPAIIEMLDPFNDMDAFAGLEQVSHLWLTFVFSENIDEKTRLKVRPPRLGGNKKLGVFATRSSFRPNGLGQSLVKLNRIEMLHKRVLLHVQGIDLLDGTPIVDIKPYLPYADIVHNASCVIAQSAPNAQRLCVGWQPVALQILQKIQGDKSVDVQRWITDIIALDPRPAYQSAQKKNAYAMSVFSMNIHWQMQGDLHADIIFVELL